MLSSKRDNSGFDNDWCSRDQIIREKGSKKNYGFVPFLISLTNFSRFKKKIINTR